MDWILLGKFRWDALWVSLTTHVQKSHQICWFKDIEFCYKISFICNKDSIDNDKNAAIHRLNTISVSHTTDAHFK